MELHRLCIDRIEGTKAVLIDENGQAFHVPKNLLPNGTSETDVVWGTWKNGILTALQHGQAPDPVSQKIAALHRKLFPSENNGESPKNPSAENNTSQPK